MNGVFNFPRFYTPKDKVDDFQKELLISVENILWRIRKSVLLEKKKNEELKKKKKWEWKAR